METKLTTEKPDDRISVFRVWANASIALSGLLTAFLYMFIVVGSHGHFRLQNRQTAIMIALGITWLAGSFVARYFLTESNANNIVVVARRLSIVIVLMVVVYLLLIALMVADEVFTYGVFPSFTIGLVSILLLLLVMLGIVK